VQAQLGEPLEQPGLVAAEHGAHAGLDLRRRLGHRDAALRDELHRIGLAQDAGGGSRCELADRVAGHAADALAPAALRDRGEAEQRGRDDQRLGDRGIPDRVGVAEGAMRAQVDAGRVGEGIEVLGEPGLREPWVEESGGLRALTGRDDDDSHGFHPALWPRHASNVAHQIIARSLADTSNVLGGARPRAAAPGPTRCGQGRQEAVRAPSATYGEL
jgi:hypothetical protein